MPRFSCTTKQPSPYPPYILTDTENNPCQKYITLKCTLYLLYASVSMNDFNVKAHHYKLQAISTLYAKKHKIK